MIQRPFYIQKIEPFIDKNVVKVLTGIRRCGKSCLMTLLRDRLLERGVPSEQIVEINFESRKNPAILSVDSAYAFLRDLSASIQGRRLYCMLDEVQELPDWEKLVNSLSIDFDCDLYLTGSNAHLLSGELATHLGGRYVEFHVFPLSFQEAFPLLARKGFSGNNAVREYCRRGGMPFLYDADISGEPARQYLTDVFNSVVLKDISRRHGIRDIDLLEKIILYHVSEIGHTFSASAVTRFLQAEKRNAGLETVYNYASHAEEACFTHRIRRYDLLGKALMSTQEKIFLTDVGFREAILESNQQHIDRVLENIVAMDLIRRGWNVFVGKLHTSEIDFVAERGKDRVYVQVAYLMPSEETRRREFQPLLEIPDNHPKYVVSLDDMDFSQDGIMHRPVSDFLTDEVI